MHKSAQIARLTALVLATALLGGCGNSSDSGVDSEPPAAASENPAATFLPDSALSDKECGEGGSLSTALYGALAGVVQWQAADMRCDGMPRPNGAGARLRFAGTVGDEAISIAFIIALPDLEQGAEATELASNVTVIEEGRSRFFSTPDLESCWTDIEVQSALDDSGVRFVIDGVLYCISPLPEVNGEASLSIPELRFSGQVDWSAK